MLKIILKKIEKLIDLMLEEREDRQRERQERDQRKSERELAQYVRSKQKEVGPPLMQSSNDDPDRPVRTKAPILIPYGLNEDQKMLIEDFYNKD